MSPYDKRPCPLTKRLAEDMKIRNLAANTIDAYTYHARRFADFIQKPLDLATVEDVRSFQLYLIETRKLAYSSFNQADSQRMQIRVTQGKGAKQRQVPTYQPAAKNVSAVARQSEPVDIGMNATIVTPSVEFTTPAAIVIVRSAAAANVMTSANEQAICCWPASTTIKWCSRCRANCHGWH